MNYRDICVFKNSESECCVFDSFKKCENLDCPIGKTEVLRVYNEQETAIKEYLSKNLNDLDKINKIKKCDLTQLSEWENQFLKSVQGRGQISEKQSTIIDRILKKLTGETK